jgi:hypothetical protein
MHGITTLAALVLANFPLLKKLLVIKIVQHVSKILISSTMDVADKGSSCDTLFMRPFEQILKFKTFFNS